MKLETFIDPAYYDMWCVKPEGMKDFNSTLHFVTEKEARNAIQVIEKWMNREWVGLTDEEIYKIAEKIKLTDDHVPHHASDYQYYADYPKVIELAKAILKSKEKTND